MSDLTDTPVSPPTAAEDTSRGIPVGIGTQLGIIGSALLALAGALAPLLPDTGAGTSKWLIVCATVLSGLTILGRMLQGVAAILADRPRPGASVLYSGVTRSFHDDDGEPDPEEPDFDPIELSGATYDEPELHSGKETAAYKEFGQPTPKQIEEGNKA